MPLPLGIRIMNSTLVCVVCDRDLWNFELLVRSIGKFMDPCRLIFIYNEERSKYKFFKEWYYATCAPVIKKFNTKLYHKDILFGDYDLDDVEHRLYTEPIYDQQLLKLFVHTLVETEYYTVFDCKNFITKPCRLTNIKQTKPENIAYADHYLRNWCMVCCAKLDVRYRGVEHLYLSSNITPFVMHKKTVAKLIKHFKGKKELHKWMLSWCGDDSNMAEFYLYEIFCISKNVQDPGQVPGNSLTIWEHCFKDPRMLKGLTWYVKTREEKAKFLEFEYYVSGFHTHTRKYLEPAEIYELLEYWKMEDCWPKRGCPFKKTVLR